MLSHGRWGSGRQNTLVAGQLLTSLLIRYLNELKAVVTKAVQLAN